MTALSQATRKSLLNSVLLTAVLMLWLIPGPCNATLQAVNGKVDKSGLLQFSAAGHALRFSSGSLIAAGVDHALQIDFIGARRTSPHATNPVLHPANGAQSLDTVTYPDLWPGINLIYTGGNSILESTYIIAPRKQTPGKSRTASPVESIRLRYNVPVALDGNGNLVLAFQNGQMRESAPVAWQVIHGRRVPVKAAFHLLDKQEIGFRVGVYDPAYPLVIDPVLTWHTFMGSEEVDIGNAIEVDAAGNIYVTGQCYASWETPLNTHAGGSDAFVAKLDSTGSRVWHTYLGSGNFDTAHALALDPAGNIYVAGTSSASWGSPLNAYTGGSDAFAAKLDSAGNRLWNTFMGSSSSETAYGIAVDANGNAFVAGYGGMTWGTPINGYAGGMFDGFAAKLDTNGNRIWNTFIGSSEIDYGNAVAVDPDGNALVAGISSGAWGSPVNAYAGSTDAYVLKLDSAGNRIWNTFMGSASADYGVAVAADGLGNIYAAGYSIAIWGSPVNVHTGGGLKDGFAAKLDGNGNLMWNTFMGSAMDDVANDLAVSPRGGIVVTGKSDATWGLPDNVHAGGEDVFAIQLDMSGNRLWHTFMGSAGRDYGNGITASAAGDIYATGLSESTWGSPIEPHSGDLDVFVAALADQSLLLVNISGTGSGTVTSSPSGIDCGQDCHALFAPGAIVTLSAAPDADMIFGSWIALGCADSTECTVVLDANKDVTAMFYDPSIDTDLDGISDLDEQGPSFDNPAYDGNADGIADWLQWDASSCPSFDGSRYMTTAYGGTELTNTITVPVDAPAATPPAGVEFPYGLYRLSISGNTGGFGATATLYLVQGDTPSTYYKYGPTPDDSTDHWYEFMYDGETGAEINGNVITLHFVDGQRGDGDLDGTNGIIIDPGGPAFTGNGDGNSGGGSSGCFIGSLKTKKH